MYYPIHELKQYSIHDYSEWLTYSMDSQNSLLDDPFIGSQLRAYEYQARNTEHDSRYKPWYRGTVRHPYYGFVNGFGERFPEIVEVLQSLPVENPHISMQITWESLITKDTQHFDSNNGESFSLRAYLVTDGTPRLFFRNLNPLYQKYYLDRKIFKYTNVPEHHCVGNHAYPVVEDFPHVFALSNSTPHGFDFEGNTGRVALVINGKVNESKLTELIESDICRSKT